MASSKDGESFVESINAVTLFTHDMGRAVGFYRALGFAVAYGGEEASFTSFRAGGTQYLNIVRAADETRWSHWGRMIFHVSDVDAQHRRALEAGLTPSFEPRDAAWGERYFHIFDPDGHEISFAKRLRPPRA